MNQIGQSSLLARRLVDMVSVPKMKPASELREEVRRLTERNVFPVESDLAIGHVDAHAAIRVGERVMGKVKIDRLELSQRAHDGSRSDAGAER